MESENNSAESQILAARVVAGDDAAADEVFRRYIRRLTALARARLAPQIGRRVDPEDAVQSAFRSFFLGARTGRFTINRSGDLWRLLATITARKVSRLSMRHRAAKRSVGKEAVSTDSELRSNYFPADPRSPSPADAAALADELTQIMRELPMARRRTLELRLQDASVTEIAADIKCSERTIRRWLAELQGIFERRLGTVGENTPKTRSAPGAVDEVPPMRDVSKSSAIFAGQLPDVDYRDLVLQSHLGTGGMGRVYRAWRRSAAREVAVKVLKKRWQTNAAAVDRFVEEATMVATLDHPNITRLHGIGRMPGGGCFFVMDLVEGDDLQQRIDAGTVQSSQIIGWIRQAADAVAATHAHGIIHCDLKPSNLLLDRWGNIVVSDFGFAIALAASRRPVGGTLAFIAPELIDDRWGGPSPATDVWGLGAVLYSLLFKRAPWTETSPADLIERVNRGNPEFPEATTSPLIIVCRRCLAIDPSERFGDARAVADAIADPSCR